MRKTIRFLILFIFSCFLYTTSGNTTLSAQSITVRGNITDRMGEELVGTTVGVAGTTIGTMTDIDGNFEINIPDANSVLRISYAGFKTQEITVGEHRFFRIVMESDIQQLQEVEISVGYGTMRKSDIGGAVASITGDELRTSPALTFEQMLQGRIAGVNVIQNSGAPGSEITIMIRGAGSLSGSSQPLYVIDGYPIETSSARSVSGSDQIVSEQPGQNPMANINPNDIESIEILKDASATAIYGSRGANGVILITTKGGKAGRTKIDYSYRADVSQLPKFINVLNAREYYKFYNETYSVADRYPQYSEFDLDSLAQYNQNWQDMTYRTAFSQEHNISISGGNEGTTFSLSGNFADMEGIIINSRYKRGGMRLNLDHKMNNRLTIGTRATINRSTNNASMYSSRNGQLAASAVNNALMFKPVVSVGDYEDEAELLSIGQSNPYMTMTKIKSLRTEMLTIVSAFARYKLTKELEARVSANGQYNEQMEQQFHGQGTYTGDSKNGYAFVGNGRNYNYAMDYTLTYNKTINKIHRINAVVGYTWQEWFRKVANMSVQDFGYQGLYYNNLSYGLTPNAPASADTEDKMASWLGRATYTLKDRYILVATGRYDGSTRLAPGHKWNFFPSVALAYRISEEPFMSDYAWLDNLKLKISYGVAGNRNIGIGASRQSYALGYYQFGTDENGKIYPGFTASGMGNSELTWEKNKQWNYGIEMSVLNGRVSAEFNYYNKLTDGMLMNMRIPGSMGYTTKPVNMGEISNKGVEFSLTVVPIENRDFTWLVNGNISANRNKVKSLGSSDMIGGTNYISSSGYSLNYPINYTTPGKPIGSFYGFIHEGIYQNWDEIANDPVAVNAGLKPGDLRFRDISGPDGVPDGKIDDHDKTWLGNAFPDYVFGIGNTFTYKNFTLNVFITGSVGNDIVNLNKYVLAANCDRSNLNQYYDSYMNRWRGDGTGNNAYPSTRPTYTEDYWQKRFNSYFVEDGSYIRLKTVSFSYDVPVKKIAVLNKYIQSLRATVTGTNLYMWTNYSWYDPEVTANSASSLSPGVDWGTFPLPRSVSFGLNVGF